MSKRKVDIWEALKAQKPSRPATPNLVGEEERQLQRAIQASLELHQSQCNSQPANNDSPDTDPDLHMALMLSQQELEEAEQQRIQEEKMLEKILELSLTEK